MNLWTVALTVYIAFCIQAVNLQGETVFSISFKVEGQPNYFNFSETLFYRFYHCLCNKDHTLCNVQRNNKYEVTTVKTCPPVISSQKTDAFSCRPVGNNFVCKGVNFPPPGVNESQCTTTYNIEDDRSLSQQVRLIWDGVNSVTMENYAMAYGITVSILSGNNRYEISGTFISKVTTTATITTPTTVKTTRTGAPGQASTFFSKDSSTITSPGTNKQRSDDDGDDNNMSIIIGAAVGGAVLVAIIVTIVIVLWRRKKRTSLSSKSSGGNYEDTDIYPYGDSTMSNIEPNLRPSNLNSRSEQSTQITYSTVDPNKKLNKTQKSSDTNNANKLQQKKSRFNQNLDYTDVDIDSDAGHYQRSSDVHNGQGIANRVTISSPAPNPSAKPTSYDISSETDEDPKERYSQVVKTNKNKDARAIDGGGAGSNHARDSSGYEEAKPRTDTQYTTVMDSSDKNTPNPAPDGVYAKLHDPVRNITDVYNEWPATDNAGE